LEWLHEYVGENAENERDQGYQFRGPEEPYRGREKLDDERIEDATKRSASGSNACRVASTTAEVMSDNGNGRREQEGRTNSTE
jgi:hypothetical protein